jgi:hypothetical protein
MGSNMTSRSPGRPPAACTIISRNYLSHARILAQSYTRHHPGARFYLLVVDGLPQGTEAGADVELLGPDDLALPNFYEMCFEYDVAELCTAIKPSLLLLLFDRFGEDQVLFLDPDIMVMRPLEELREPLASASIALTPNLLRPIPLDGKRPNEQDILLAGAFNLGFIGVRKSPQAYEFLRWWAERLQRGGAVVDVPRGLMTDQKWADLVPGLFPATVILRDDTYNVAWWNMHHRALARQGEQFLVNGRPLAFFHFSGFDPSRPRQFTKECENRTKVVAGTALAELLARYAALHMENGYRETRKWVCGFSRFDNGAFVNLPLRRLYLDLDAAQRERFGDPFRAGGADSFLDWATRPDPADEELSPFLKSLYQVRFDLWNAFPDVRGRDRGDFLVWARTDGARQMKYDPKQMRIPGSDAPDGGDGGPAEGGAGGAAAALGRNGSAAVADVPAARGAELMSDAAAEAVLTQVPPEPVRRYQHMVWKIRDVVRAALPADATVIVVSRGDDQLVQLGCRAAWHFPQGEDGDHTGHNPTDSAEAVRHLEELRARGGQFLLIPATALWWLEHYDGLRRHLEERYRVVVRLEQTCVIFALADGGR